MKISDIPRVQRLQQMLADLKLAVGFEALDIHISIRKGDRRVTLNPEVLGALLDEAKVRLKITARIAQIEAELATLGAEVT